MRPQDRVRIVQRNLESLLENSRRAAERLANDEPLRPGTTLTAATARQLFADQVLSRSLDIAAREMKLRGTSFYTISSAGHEQNVVLGELLRPSDPCLLHYRAGAMMVARLRKSPARDAAREILLSVCAKLDDPVCRGRHKVWGSRELWVPPQTSTIASHLPKAVGFAFGFSRTRKLGVDPDLPRDTIVCCSFGDASANHATALTGINAARYAVRQGQPAPVLFVCEDNKRGISVDTPPGWIEARFVNAAHLHYVRAAGEVDDVWDACRAAIRTCRTTRSPVFLHLDCVRLWGHAGTDVEAAYLDAEEIERTEAADPLLRNARRLIETGAASPDELLTLVRDAESRVAELVPLVEPLPHMMDVAEIVRPVSPFDEARTRESAAGRPDPRARTRSFGGELPERAGGTTRRTMAAHINSALADEMLRRPEVVVFGEDVGRKGGVYNVTSGLQRRFGPARVFDTLLDETTILGLAQGMAQLGLLPVPEIQYLAYLHNAIDQLRGEACSLTFFSDGQFANPMVVRIASFAYQRGFGGHFHHDNSIGALRDIPGLALAAPARGDDAARLLRGALAMARENGRVVCFLEPIALYHEKDLYESGDRGWLFDYPEPGEALLPGEVGVYNERATDVLIASYSNGLRLSLRAARRLESEHGIRCRVLDLRWLSPLPLEQLRSHADACAAVLIVDECRATGGGVADAIIAGLAEGGFAGRCRSVRSADSYIPLGPGAWSVLVGEDDIVAAAAALAGAGN
jgi:2-oxoisovalerate dehydrogenase E1 component